MSTKEILLALEKLGFVVTNPKTKMKIVTDKWYDALEDPRPGIRNLEELSVKYLSIWPEGVKSGGLYVRSGLTTIMSKFREFFKRFPYYTDEEILAATQRYVDESRRDNYQYMKTAEYFILKNGGSVLESYCEVVKHNGTFKSQSNIRTV